MCVLSLAQQLMRSSSSTVGQTLPTLVVAFAGHNYQLYVNSIALSRVHLSTMSARYRSTRAPPSPSPASVLAAWTAEEYLESVTRQTGPHPPPPRVSAQWPFPDFQPGRSEHATRSTYLTNIDIRKEPLHVRSELLDGPVLQLQINDYCVATIPQHLLRAAATFFPYKRGHVLHMLPGTDARGVRILTQHLVELAHSASPQRLQDNMTLYDSLAVCQVSYSLGLTRYTNHVFARMDKYLSRCIPSYDEIDAVLHFSQFHWRLLASMVKKLAFAVWKEEMRDVDGFARFCLERPGLKDAIDETMWEQRKLARWKAQRKVRRAGKQERGGRERNA